MKQKIAIIGSGNVGGALKRGLAKAGHEVRDSQRGTARETGDWGEVVFLRFLLQPWMTWCTSSAIRSKEKQSWMSRTR